MALTRGRMQEVDPDISDLRSLSRADLAVLHERRPVNTLQTLRDTHHRVARTVAAGVPHAEVVQLCGISYQSLMRYRADPAFMELVAHYRGLVTAEYVRSIDSFMEVATSNMLKAATLVSDRLDAAMEDGASPLPLTQLMAISDSGADRFGYGKMQKNLNVNVDFAAQLEAARNRSAKARDITPSPTLAPTIEASSFPVSPQSGPTHNRPPPGSGQSTFRRL